MQGRLDSPLTAQGIGQAQALGVLLNEEIENPARYHIVSSPLGRAWQTAVIVAEGLGLAPQDIAIDRRLAELAYGHWEGLTVDQIKERFAEDWMRRRADRWNIKVPGGECYAEVAERAGAWLSEISEADRIIAVCHGVTSRVLRGLYAHLSKGETIELLEPQDSLYRLSEGRIEQLDAHIKSQ